MAYDSKTWNDNESGGTPIDAASLNHLEGGVQDLSDTVDAGRLSETNLAATIESMLPEGIVVLPYGSATPEDPEPGILYLRKSTPDSLDPGEHDQSIPSVVAAGSAAFGSSASAANAVIPGTTLEGDVLVFVVVNSQSSTISLPAGWTQRAANLVGSLQVQVWTKTALSTDAGTSVTASGSTGKWCAQILDCTGDFNVAGSFGVRNNATGNVVTAPGISPGSSSMIIAVMADRAAGTVPPNTGVASPAWDFPSGWTTQGAATSDQSVSAGGVGFSIATRDALTSTATGDVVATSDNTNTYAEGVIFAIKGVS